MRQTILKTLPFLKCALIGLELGSVKASASNQVIVKLNGTAATIIGQAEDNNILGFKGIRFAEPPTGIKRFTKATPVAYDSTKTIQASSFPPACPQDQGNLNWYRTVAKSFGGDASVIEPLTNISEDCLFLNIWVPQSSLSALPVMVWVHGGSNVNGWSYEPNYHGHKLATKGVIVVSVQYRLGNLGFLPLPFDDAPTPSGHYGISDLTEAIKWIKHHIKSFGGDPNNITLFGESAGGGNIAALMQSPKAKGLFHKAIIQSGALERIKPGPDTHKATTFAATIFKSANINTLKQAREKSWQDLVALDRKGYYHSPLVDDTPVKSGSTVMESGIKLLIGSNRNEWLMYLEKDGDKALEYALTPYKNKATAKNLAGNLFDGQFGMADHLATMSDFYCPSLSLAKQVSSVGGTAYVYEFNRIRAGGEKLKSYHGAEIPYVFGTHDPWLPTNETDKKLTETMMAYWSNFARTGDPNGEKLPIWRPYQSSQPYIQSLGDTVGKLINAPREICQYLSKE